MNTRVWALIKIVAMQDKQLPALWCESELVSSAKQYPGTAIDDSFLEDAKSARNAAMQHMGSKAPTAESLKTMFSKNGAFLASVDRFIKIEQLFFDGCSGAKGEIRLKEEILSRLPDENRPVTPEQSVSQLSALSKSMLMTWIGAGGTALLQMTLTMVQAIHSNRAPRFDDGLNSAFGMDVRRQLAFFLRIEPIAGKATTATAKVGRNAAMIKYAQAEEKYENQELAMEDLQHILVFAWLLLPEQQKQCEAWRREIVKGGPDVCKPSAKLGGPKRTTDKKKCVGSLFAKR